MIILMMATAYGLHDSLESTRGLFVGFRRNATTLELLDPQVSNRTGQAIRTLRAHG